jgi:hypothetical protein
MDIAALSTDPSDVSYYRELAIGDLRLARIHARRAATILRLSNDP